MAAYYIDVNTGSDANVGSSGSPWKTLAHAALVMHTGDSVTFQGGDYTPPSGGTTDHAALTHLTTGDPHTQYVLDTDLTAHVGDSDPHTGYQKESEKSAANGYASLDSGGKVPDGELPAGLARDSEVTSAVSAHEAAGDPHTGYQKESEKGVANGYAGLDSGGLVPTAQLPASSGAPSSAEYVTSASDGTLSAEVAIPGLAGSADRKGAAGASFADEFDSSDLSAYAWTSSPNGVATVVNADTTVPSHLWISDSQALERWFTRAWVPGNVVFDVRMKVSLTTFGSSGNAQIGLFVMSAAFDKGFIAICETLSDSVQFIVMGQWYDGGYHSRGNYVNIGTNALYLRITRDGGNASTYSVWYSMDGISWVLVVQSFENFTVGRVGVELNSGNAQPHGCAVDWIRGT